jgi:hypothetical protein
MVQRYAVVFAIDERRSPKVAERLPPEDYYRISARVDAAFVSCLEPEPVPRDRVAASPGADRGEVARSARTMPRRPRLLTWIRRSLRAGASSRPTRSRTSRLEA